MIVGELIRIQGTIEGDEDLVVRGRIEGVVRIGGAIIVEAGGWVLAEISAREVTVHGTVRGNVSAVEGIEIARTGRMIGDVMAPRVSIATGAAFRGRIEIGDVSAAEAVSSSSAKPAEAEVQAPAPAAEAATAHAALQQPRSLPSLARPRSTLKRRTEG